MGPTWLQQEERLMNSFFIKLQFRGRQIRPTFGSYQWEEKGRDEERYKGIMDMISCLVQKAWSRWRQCIIMKNLMNRKMGFFCLFFYHITSSGTKQWLHITEMACWSRGTRWALSKRQRWEHHFSHSHFILFSRVVAGCQNGHPLSQGMFITLI